MTNREARPHLVKSNQATRLLTFNEYLYADQEDFRALQEVLAMGIDLRDFRLEVEGGIGRA